MQKSDEQLLDEFLNLHYTLTKEFHQDPEFRNDVKNTLGFASYRMDNRIDNVINSITPNHKTNILCLLILIIVVAGLFYLYNKIDI